MQVFKKEKYVINEKGKKTAAIIPIKKVRSAIIVNLVAIS